MGLRHTSVARFRSLRDDWRYTAGVVSGGHFLSHFYLLVLPPLFPMMRVEFGLTNTELGIIVSTMSIATLLQVPVGALVDRIGAKWVFVAGLALSAVGIALIGVAPTYVAVLAFAGLSGVGQSAFHPADYAMLDSVTDASSQGKGFSIHTFSGYAGFAVAPVLVSALALAIGWRSALVVVGIAGLVYGAVAAAALETVYLDRLDDSAASSASSLPGGFFHPRMLVLFGFFVVLTLAGKGIQTFTSVLVVTEFALTETVGSTALTVYFTLASVGIFVGGFLADWYPPRRVIGGSLGIASLVTWFLVGSRFPVAAGSVWLLFGVLGFFVGLVFPSRDRLVSSVAPAESTGKSFGFVFTGITVGGVVGPVVLGGVIDATTAATAFLLVGAFYLGAAGLVLPIGE